MGLFGSTKVESGTKAYDQSATVQDQGVGIGSGSRNTVDQSLNDNSGAITGKVGNNNTISTSIVTTSMTTAPLTPRSSLPGIPPHNSEHSRRARWKAPC